MRTTPTRGLTLVELIVALAASAIVLVGVISAVKAQQDAYNGGQRVREAQGSVRNALLFIEQKLALAGYGMDPALAFDFSDPTAAGAWYSGPCPADAAPCAKDRTDGSDELVFHARNPAHWESADGTQLRGRVWQFKGFGADTVTLAARNGDLFLKGQILQGVCDRGLGQRYFTVRTTYGPVAAPYTPPAPPPEIDVTIELEPETDLGNPFRRQSAGDCQPARVFQIDRYRVHVRPMPLGDGRFEPYLVLDTGIDVNRDGALDEDDESLLAPGVEVLQVAYEFTPSFAAGADVGLPPAGITPATPVTFVAGAPNATVAAARALAVTADATADRITRPDFTSATAADAQYYRQASLYDYRFGPPLAPERATNYAANVMAVRIALVTRSAGETQAGAAGALPGSGGPVLNLDQTPAWIATYAASRGGRDGYERIRLESRVHLPNMVSRRLLFQ